MPKSCNAQMEVYSRVCGYFRPVKHWNHGKKEEFKDRKLFAWKKNASSVAGQCSSRTVEPSMNVAFAD
jgi:ribonucleoside-triphosphate reductase